MGAPASSFLSRSWSHPGEQGVENSVDVCVGQWLLSDQQAEVQRAGEDRHCQVQVEVGRQLALVSCRLQAGDGLVRLRDDEALIERGGYAGVVLGLADQGPKEGLWDVPARTSMAS